MKTLIEKFPGSSKTLHRFQSTSFDFIRGRNYFYFLRRKCFFQRIHKFSPDSFEISRRKNVIPSLAKTSHLYPRRSRRTRVRVGKHGAYQVETSVSTQLTPPNLIVAASTSARCRSTTLSKSARCSVRECFAVIYKFEGRRLTLSDVDRQACHLNVLLTILFPSPSSNRSNWVSSADLTFFATFLHFFFE